MGELFCYDGVDSCPGSDAVADLPHRCYVHDVWSGTPGGYGYYILFNYVNILSDETSNPRGAISARCVRGLKKSCLSIW